MTASASIPTRSATTRLGALVAGLLLVLVAVQPAMAVSWGGESRLSAADNHKPTILRTGPSRAIAIWQRGSTLYARRTADGGVTWTTRQTVASGIFLGYSAASNGASVDVAYTKRTVHADGSSAVRLYYRRSTDHGATWKTAKALTSSTSKVMDQAVARKSGGRVSVVWTGMTSGNLYMRTSSDGGATFGAARFVAKTNNWEPGRTITYRSDPQLAIGSGVTYIAYLSARDTLTVRRSTNNGATWSAAKTLSTHAQQDFDVVAADGKAAIVYTTTASGVAKAAFRRTIDKGATWSSSRQLVSVPSGSFSQMPQLAYRAGVLAAIVKFGPPGDSPIWHRQSTDFGLTWSTPTRFSQEHFADTDPEPGGIAILDGRQLAGYNENREDPNEGFWVRRTQ